MHCARKAGNRNWTVFPASGGDPYFSRESSEAIQKAGDFTREFNDKYASVEHLLLSVFFPKKALPEGY